MRWIDRSCLSTLLPPSLSLPLLSAPLFHSPSLSVCLSFTGNESFSLCSVAGDLPLLLALLPGTFWGQFESRRESDTQSNRARGRGSSGNGGKCSRNADQGEGDQGTEGKRGRVYGGAEPVHLPATSLPSSPSPSPSLRARSMR